MKRIAIVLFAFSCAHEAPARNWSRDASIQMASSHRCQGQHCTCRDANSAGDAAESNPPASGMRRYEIRVGASMDAVWVDVEGRGTWFKQTEATESGCVYVDLKPGDKVRVTEHVEAMEKTHGTALDMRIAEYNPSLHVWYDTARMECGGGGDACNREMLIAWTDGIHKLTRGLHDQCGSTKIEEPHWNTPETDLPHPPAITADLILHVYTFEPKSPPGAADCGKRHKDVE